jgi:DNA-binding NtrC family response regulator
MLKILIVDDSQDSRLYCEMIAQMMDMEAELAASANVALTKLQAGYEPDIVLTDLVMPGRDPKDLVDYLAGHLPDTKVILMSALSDVGMCAADIGADAAIMKPLNVPALVAKIRELSSETMSA